MSLTAEQIKRFRTDGYLIVPNFFSDPEVRAIQAEVERFKRDGLLNNVATDGDGKTMSTKVKNLQLCPMAHKSDLFRALPFDNKVVETVSQLIGEPFILHLDQIFLKPGGDGMGTSWHQDNAYFKIPDPMKGTAMWVAVHDATLANGTMHVIPGAFNEELPHSRDPMSNHHIRCYPDETREVPCIIPAGSAVFFCYGTPHCTKGNKTDKERAGIAFHFLHVDCCHKELLADHRNYWPYLTGPKATGGREEYGTTISGCWPTEVAKAIQVEAAFAGSK
jgi:ectoine hydroxylase-related dioxygenase (phytanoyl-CoA dioxygenase family)